MNEVREVFNFNQHALTVITDKEGEPWFIAKEVCDILKHTNVTMAMKMLSADEIAALNFAYPGKQSRIINIVNESGLYSLIFKSTLKEAVTFRKWVTTEVLPKIRKTGRYEMADKTEMERIAEAVILAQKYLSEAREKVQFYDRVAIAENTHLIREVAKILKLPYGQNIFYRKLKELGILMKNNEPYQQHVDAGYFKVLLREYTSGEKSFTSKTTVVTGKGIEWLEKKMSDVDSVAKV